MMTYGGNMNGFDEASPSFFNAVKWAGGRLEGGVCVCLCVDPVASWHPVVSEAPLIFAGIKKKKL